MKTIHHLAIRLAILLAVFFACAAMQMDVRQQSGESFPATQQPDQQDSQNTMEILPASYLGCWRGVVAQPDMLQNLNGCLNGPSVPELYTLCYRKNASGKFEVTFGDVQLDTNAPGGHELSGTSGKVDVISSDGISRVRLRSVIHFDQKRAPSKGDPDSKWSVDAFNDMFCEIKDAEMEVRAAFIQNADGTACFRGTWHARFHRFEE